MGVKETGSASGVDPSPPIPSGADPAALPASLDVLLEAVVADPESFDAYGKVADTLMSLGYAAEGARWRSFGLHPPPPQRLKRSIRELRRLLPGSTSVAGSPGIPALRRVQNTDDPERILEIVQGLLESGDLHRARVHLRTLAHRQNLTPALCNRVGMLEERAGEYRQAEAWYRISLRQIPAQHMVWFPLAKVLLEQQAWDEALAAAEQGLRLSPGHPWGLKLRTKALAATGAIETLTLLARHGGIAVEVLTVSPEEKVARRQRLLRSRSWSPPPSLSVLERMRLKRMLSQRSPFWVMLHGRGPTPLEHLREAALVPENLVLQPLASRDPMALRNALGERVADIRPEEPTSLLSRLDDIGLVVLHRAHRACLPVVLRSVFERSIPIIAPAHWLRAPRGYGVVAHHSGWELFWPDDPLD